MTDQDESEGIGVPRGPATIQDRIAAFGMLDKMTEATQAQKIVRLTLVGFNRNDVASMLQVTVANVTQVLYLERKKSQKTPKATRGKGETSST